MSDIKEKCLQIIELGKKATPGPWNKIPMVDFDKNCRNGNGDVYGVGPCHRFNFKTEEEEQTKARLDQDFINESRNDAPQIAEKLLKAIEVLETITKNQGADGWWMVNLCKDVLKEINSD